MNDQHRIFIGLSFKSEKNSAFKEVIKKLKISADKKNLDIKWTPEDNLHLTLKFIGEVSNEQVAVASGSLKEIAPHFSTFKLILQGLGGFPDETQARVLFMGVKNKRNLQELQSQIEDVIAEKLGITKEYDYTPHITLARLRNKKHIKDLISPFVRKSFGDIPVQKIQLFESFLQGNYPIYKIIGEFPLHED